jgi:hypothetical protein
LETTLQYAGVNIITVPLSIAHGTFYEYTALGMTTAAVYIYEISHVIGTTVGRLR